MKTLIFLSLVFWALFIAAGIVLAPAIAELVAVVFGGAR
jgi:hypothetical protein